MFNNKKVFTGIWENGVRTQDWILVQNESELDFTLKSDSQAVDRLSFELLGNNTLKDIKDNLKQIPTLDDSEKGTLKKPQTLSTIQMNPNNNNTLSSNVNSMTI